MKPYERQALSGSCVGPTAGILPVGSRVEELAAVMAEFLPSIPEEPIGNLPFCAVDALTVAPCNVGLGPVVEPEDRLVDFP